MESSADPAEHVVLGRRVSLPVEVRDCAAFFAVFAVPALAAEALIDYSGLDVLRHRSGKALCGLLFVDYRDSDLGRYREFGVAIFVRPPGGSGASAGSDLAKLVRGRAGVLIHRLPVDQRFTLEAGRGIWGFPKVLSRIDLDEQERRGVLRLDDEPVVDLRVARGVAVPGAGATTSLDAYTRFDGVTRRVPWRMRASGTRLRPGGAELRLGRHEVADELAELGLPRRALMSTSISALRMSFGRAEQVRTQH